MRTSMLGILALVALLPAANAGTERGTVVHQRFHADALGVSKSYFVYLPASYFRETARRYPVLFLLHGWGGNEADWIGRGNIDEVADATFRAEALEMILVMPDGDNGWYMNWERRTNWDTCVKDARQAASEFCVKHGRYADYITQDLLQHVTRNYRVIDQRSQRGVAGFSMGGFGALYLGFTRPEVFGAVASLAGTGSQLYAGPHPFQPPARYQPDLSAYEGMYPRWRENEGFAFGLDISTWRKHDLGQLVLQAPTVKPAPPAIYITIGAQDMRSIDANRALVHDLQRLGVAHEYRETEGVHTWGFVAAREAEVLRWFAAQFRAAPPR